MNPEEHSIILHIKKTLLHAYCDIEKAYQGESMMGAFILCSCFIDALAGFQQGQDGRLKLGKVFRAFVEEYLKDYDKVELYYNLRCQLVHNYSEGGSYKFTWGSNALHLQPIDEKKKYINLENLISDLKNAMNQYFNDLDQDEDLHKRAVVRYEKYGLVKNS